MWNTINHDATAVVDTGNIASTAKNYGYFASAIVNHDLHGWNSTSWSYPYAFNFAGNFGANTTLQLAQAGEVKFIEMFAESFGINFSYIGRTTLAEITKSH